MLEERIGQIDSDAEAKGAHRHSLGCGLTIEQAFGYGRAGRRRR
jgi:hypothetical protein